MCRGSKGEIRIDWACFLGARGTFPAVICCPHTLSQELWVFNTPVNIAQLTELGRCLYIHTYSRYTFESVSYRFLSCTFNRKPRSMPICHWATLRTSAPSKARRTLGLSAGNVVYKWSSGATDNMNLHPFTSELPSTKSLLLIYTVCIHTMRKMQGPCLPHVSKDPEKKTYAHTLAPMSYGKSGQSQEVLQQLGVQ